MSVLATLAMASITFLIGVWVAYPAIVWLLGRLLSRESSGSPGDRTPTVSVVIASREAAAALITRVANCLASDYPALEEIVVSLDRPRTHQDDAIEALAPGHVRVLESEVGGKAAALNVGVAAARGDILVFADTHQMFEPDSVTQLLRHFADPALGAVGGVLRIRGGEALLARLYWRYELWLRRCEARLHSPVGVSGCVWALRRSLWKPLPEGLLLDDVYTPMRIILEGWRVGLAQAAYATEQRQVAARGEYARKVRTLTGVLQLCGWLPAVLSPVGNPVWAQFMMHKMMRMLTPIAVGFVLLYCLVSGVVLFSDHLLVLALLGAVTGLWLISSRSIPARRVRGVLVEGTLLQAAVVVAGFNGLRGKWKVWNG